MGSVGLVGIAVGSVTTVVDVWVASVGSTGNCVGIWVLLVGACVGLVATVDGSVGTAGSVLGAQPVRIIAATIMQSHFAVVLFTAFPPLLESTAPYRRGSYRSDIGALCQIGRFL